MKSQSDYAIVKAVEQGYTADEDGNIYTPYGKLMSNRSRKRAGHLSITLRLEGFNERGFQAVLAHRFIAYYFYGDDLFKHQCVRHLNDVPHDNRLKNLALGTFKENRADIPREKISGPAKKHAHKLVARCRKLSDEDVIALRKEREENSTPYYKIAAMFGVTTMTAHRACNGAAWKNI